MSFDQGSHTGNDARLLLLPVRFGPKTNTVPDLIAEHHAFIRRFPRQAPKDGLQC